MDDHRSAEIPHVAEHRCSECHALEFHSHDPSCSKRGHPVYPREAEKVPPGRCPGCFLPAGTHPHDPSCSHYIRPADFQWVQLSPAEAAALANDGKQAYLPDDIAGTCAECGALEHCLHSTTCSHSGNVVTNADGTPKVRLNAFVQTLLNDGKRAHLPDDAAIRKGIPAATGFVDYFPDAIIAVATLSRIGNDQHNPGKPLHWDRSKSSDEADALFRHFLDRGTYDTDGVRHSTKVAWRALALLQKEIEADRRALDTRG